jgi:hypothetical protein
VVRHLDRADIEAEPARDSIVEDGRGNTVEDVFIKNDRKVRLTLPVTSLESALVKPPEQPRPALLQRRAQIQRGLRLCRQRLNPCEVVGAHRRIGHARGQKRDGDEVIVAQASVRHEGKYLRLLGCQAQVGGADPLHRTDNLEGFGRGLAECVRRLGETLLAADSDVGQRNPIRSLGRV